MKQQQAQRFNIMCPRGLTVGIAALALLAMLTLLNACTFSLKLDGTMNGTVHPQPVPTIPLTDTVQMLKRGAGVTLVMYTTTITDNVTTFETYPVEEITQTTQLSDSHEVMALSNVYTGAVRLEYALLHSNSLKWRLFYTSTLPIEKPETWYDYLEYQVLRPNGTLTATEGTRILWGPDYTIDETIPLSSVLSTSSLPVDLADWINVLCPNDEANTCKKSIARLVFSVEANGERWRVLYLSMHTQVGTISNPDGPNSCRSNRQGRFYCWFTSWFRRHR